MPRLKTLSLLAGFIAVLAVSATPASAWWKSTLGQTQGPVHFVAPGKFVDKGATFECPLNELKAQWYLQTKGQIKEHQKNGKQEPTTEGPHLNIQIKWGNKAFDCKTKAAGVENVAMNITACELQLVQQKGSLTATAGVVTPCLITVGEGASPLCALQIPAGMETQSGSNEGINVGLTTTVLENRLENQFDKGTINAGGKGSAPGEGIHVVQQGTHSLCPVATNEEAELLGLELEAEKVNAV
jgi:hypothetical protein